RRQRSQDDQGHLPGVQHEAEPHPRQGLTQSLQKAAPCAPPSASPAPRLWTAPGDRSRRPMRGTLQHTGSTTTARSPEPGTPDPTDVRLRLRPGLTVLWRSPTHVQIGTDPRWAVTLTDLSPSAARALRSLPSGADVRALRAAFRR